MYLQGTIKKKFNPISKDTIEFTIRGIWYGP